MHQLATSHPSQNRHATTSQHVAMSFYKAPLKESCTVCLTESDIIMQTLHDGLQKLSKQSDRFNMLFQMGLSCVCTHLLPACKASGKTFDTSGKLAAQDSSTSPGNEVNEAIFLVLITKTFKTEILIMASTKLLTFISSLLELFQKQQ